MTPEQQAEQYAEERYPDAKVSSDSDKETLHTFRHIAQTAYLAGAKDKWLSYPENKPEKDGEYLVSVQYYTSTETEMATWFDDFGGWSFERAKTCGRQFVNYEVIAFMPKPEQYNP